MQRDIRFYVNNWIFGSATLAEVCRRVAAIGFDGIELVGEPGEYDAASVRRIISDHGLHVLSVCGMHPGNAPDDLRLLSHPEPAERRKATDYVKACADLAKGVGGRSVLVVPSLVGRPAPMVSREADLEASISCLREAAEYAGSLGILLTIEPINRYEVGLVNTIGEAIALAKRVDHEACRVMGDTFHMQIEEGDGIPNAIRRAGGRWLQHLHAADNTREAPGLGCMPWREILRALHDIEYEGGVSLEPLPRGASPYDARTGRIPPDTLDRALRTGLSYLREEQRLVRSFV